MTSLDDFKEFLPRYLSDASLASLFDELKCFPDNMDSRLYSSILRDSPNVFQGDGIRDLLVLELPDRAVRPSPCMIVSNTCDVSLDNTRRLPIRAIYAPILNLSRVEAMLVRSNVMRTEAVADYVRTIRRQRVSNIFFLPRCQDLDYDGIAMLDRLNNCPSESLLEGSLKARRLFTLSDYGFYLFLYKLSIHFTRVREQVARD